MNVKQTQAAIRALGLKVTRVDGEWRVNLPANREATAHYTTDNDDALGTAQAMAKRIQAPKGGILKKVVRDLKAQGYDVPKTP